MKRADLSDVLSLTTPGLSTDDLLPILSHVWFLDDRVLTYNDIIGISAPFKSGFTGAVPGKTLSALINSSGANDVMFEPSDNELIIKAGSSKFRLPILPKDSFVFDMPKQSDGASSMPGDFYRHIGNCLESCGTDPVVPEQLGVTLIPGKSDVELFATNNATVTYAKISGKPNALKDRVILSAEFCKQMLAITKSSADANLSITNDHALLTTPSGISLFGKLINSEKPLDFSAMLKHHLPADARDKAVEMDTTLRNKMKMMVERAVIITNANNERARTQITIEKGRIKFYSKSSRGEVTDTATAKLPDVSMMLDCVHLKGIVEVYDKILFTPKCVIMTKPDAIYMVAGSV